ncbi:MAG: AbrB/MazE/SpoVT family DNA-binding domain-containing protein [Clostridium paraputrificum]|uniref:AbrB/MazE/SpoVT family DNA-binding domain-containing protein n=1 Tax=Clostridium sp. TaxID=1506 RepID=UPI0025BF3E1E|nr:AbrB/MazE/SpoVT family DNA-binding domain-containing protein [Clostridium sp.]MBS5926147.1 AbrB/MazE/SpoVT family DNA-binding domain-containing protein [Clostridium sp.]
MKATGIVRKVDELGRMVIPIELRRIRDINVGDSVEIFSDNDQIILKKYEPSCTFCLELKEVINYKGKNICKKCLEELIRENQPSIYTKK